jgi:hypothetical protein
MPISKIKSSSITADAASTNLNIDAGTLYLDAANNRVGINTTTLTGSTRMVVADATGNGQIRAIHSTGLGLLINQATASGVAYIQHQDNAALAFATNNTERMRVDASGNVGIGTASPSCLFDLNQASTAFPSFKISGNNSPGMQLVETSGVTAHFVNDSAGVYFGSTSSHSLVFRTTNTERWRIDSTGNLYAGTTSVYGGGANDAKLTMVAGAPSGDPLRGNIILMDTKAYNASPLFSIMMGGQYNSSSSTTYFGGIAAGKENATDGNYAGYLSLYSRANGGGRTESIRITSAGNVGIGTSSPATTLDVRASNIAIGVTALSTAQGQAFVGTTNSWGQDIGGTLALGGAQNSGTLTQTFASISGRRESSLGYIYTGYMQLAVSDGANMVERMRITSGGNVGIGKSPLAKLDLYFSGQTSIANSTITKVTDFSSSNSFGFCGLTNNNDGVFFGMGAGGSNGIPAGIGFMREATGWNTALAFYTNNITSGPNSTDAMQEKMRIRSDGIVLIGQNSIPSCVGGTTGTTIVNAGTGTSDTGQLAIVGYNGSAAELLISGGNSSTNRRAGIRFWSQQYSTTSPTWTNGVSYSQSNGDGNMTWSNNAGSTTLTMLQNGQLKVATGSGQTRSENGVATWYTSGFTNNNSVITFDITVPDDSGTGTGIHIEANHTHINWGSYGAFLDTWIATRANAVQETRDIFNVTSGNGGAWTYSKPNNSTLRVVKSAGSYPGGGYYWIKVTTNTTL